MMFMMRDTNLDPPNPAFMGADKTPRPPADAPRWVIVVPVKSTTRAKTRLVTEPEGLIDNVALAAAFAYDTVEAALTSDQVRLVLVVTDDLKLSEGMRELGAVVVQEDTELPIESPGFARLNEAISYGEDVARFAHDAQFVAVLTGELPALKGDELSAVLTEASHYERSFVADSMAAEYQGLRKPGVIITGNVLEPRPVFRSGAIVKIDESGRERLAHLVHAAVAAQTAEILANAQQCEGRRSW